MVIPLQLEKSGIRLNVYVQPGASTDAWAGVMGEAIKVRIAAPAVEGAANRALCAFVARFFHVPKSSVMILKGQSGRRKCLFVTGDAQALASRLSEEITTRQP
jgi:uncharacterized protein